jgi:hypothetical protein
MVASLQSPLPFHLAKSLYLASHLEEWFLISLLAAELALSASGPLAGTEVTDAPAQGAKKCSCFGTLTLVGVPRAKHHEQIGYGQISW